MLSRYEPRVIPTIDRLKDQARRVLASVPADRNPTVLEQSAANDPTDLEALTALAVLRLKTGQSIAQARAPIDARPESAFYLAGGGLLCRQRREDRPAQCG